MPLGGKAGADLSNRRPSGTLYLVFVAMGKISFAQVFPIFINEPRFFNYLGLGGYLGREIQAMSIVQKQLLIDYLDSDVAEQALTVKSVRETLVKIYLLLNSSKLKN